MSLHNEIMNIQIDEKELRENLPAASFAAYKVGHRDAMHEAAELAMKRDRLIVDALEIAHDMLVDDCPLAAMDHIREALEILK